MAAHPAPQPRPRRIFIQTNSTRTGLVRAITEPVVADLRARGYAPWFDQQDIPAGADWRNAEEDAIRTCDGVLTLLDRQAHIEWPGWEGDLLSARGRERDLDVPIFVANLAREPIAPETFETSLVSASAVWERPDGVPLADVDRVARHLVEAAIATLGPPTVPPSGNLHAVLLPQTWPPEPAAQTEELDWLARLPWHESATLPAIAEDTAAIWRRQRRSFGATPGEHQTVASISPEESHDGVRCARALQALAMVFHEQSYHPEPRADLWSLPTLMDGSPKTRAREWRDFEGVRYHAEHIYARELVQSVASGENHDVFLSLESLREKTVSAISAIAPGKSPSRDLYLLQQHLDNFLCLRLRASADYLKHNLVTSMRFATRSSPQH